MRFGTYYRYALIKKLKINDHIRAKANVLDIGCYDGIFLQSLEVKERIGIDLEAIRQKNIHIIRATAEYFPFKVGLIDVMTAFDVLEHVKNPDLVMKQVTATLKTGGLFIFTIPHENENIFPRFLKNWLNFSRWGHKRVGYNRDSLKKLLKGDWNIKILYWNSALSNFLYFPLQFLWKIFQRFTKLVISRLIEIEYIRTRKNSLSQGHFIVIAKKQ